MLENTFLKRIPSKFRYGIWQVKSPQLLASCESLLADTLHSGGNIKMLQLIALVEGGLSDAWHPIWNVHLLQLVASEERIVRKADA